MTTIYCTAKLKEFIKPIIGIETPLSIEHQWNAHLLYLNGRKCIAFLHKETIYTVVLFDIVKKDLVNIEKLFIEEFIKQLYSDKILDKRDEILAREQIGEINFRPTDNDRRTLASLNDKIARLRCWNNSEPNLIERVKNYVSRHINKTPMGAIGFKYPSELMKWKIKNNL